MALSINKYILKNLIEGFSAQRLCYKFLLENLIKLGVF